MIRILIVSFVLAAVPSLVSAQENAGLGESRPFDPASGIDPASGVDPASQLVDIDEIQSIMDAAPDKVPQDSDGPSGINLLALVVRGGNFMIPIGVMSLLVVALAIERSLALRRRKMIPRQLVRQLSESADDIDRFSPTVAAGFCDEFPSPAARVIRAMLARTGRPLAEVESAARETIDREANKSAAPIRWLSLAAAATPLMGLLGTVWGMIVAFHESTTLTPDRSRSEQLSEGIYTALVTTLAGLAVAIPAAILALYLENRLLKMYHKIEELAFRVAPGLGRFAGTHRLDSGGILKPISSMPGDAGSTDASSLSESETAASVTASSAPAMARASTAGGA